MLSVFKSLLTYILTLFSIVLFLTATTGVKMYSHYCSMSNTEHSSLFESEATCGHHTLSEEVKPLEKKSCCSIQLQTETSADTDKDCCTDDSQYYRIAIAFDLPTVENKNLLPKEIVLFSAQNLSIEESIESLDNESRINEIVYPPPRFGKELLLSIQQQKTEPAPLA